MGITQEMTTMKYKIRKAAKMSDTSAYYKITFDYVSEKDGHPIEENIFAGYCKAYCTENPLDKYKSMCYDTLQHGIINILEHKMVSIHGEEDASKMFPHKIPFRRNGMKIRPHYEKCKKRLPKTIKEVRHIWVDGSFTRLPMYCEMAILIRSAILQLEGDNTDFRVSCSTSGDWDFMLIQETPWCYIVMDKNKVSA